MTKLSLFQELEVGLPFQMQSMYLTYINRKEEKKNMINMRGAEKHLIKCNILL